MINPLVDRLKAMADRIDPQTDGIAILIVGDVQYEFGVTSTGDTPFDAVRLTTAIVDAVARRVQTNQAAHCTCHPNDNPPRPCPQRYAYSECVTAAAIRTAPGLHPYQPTLWRDGVFGTH